MNPPKVGEGLVVTRRVVIGAVAGMGLLGWAVMGGERVAPVVHAGGDRMADTDGDGLVDELELVLGTSPDLVDTDGDGYSDTEELARDSSPTSAGSLPGPEEVGVGMAASFDGLFLHPVVAIYAQDGDLSTKPLKMGVLARGSIVHLPLSFFSTNSTWTEVPAAQAGAKLVVFDPSIHKSYLMRTGSLSFFATLSVNGKVVVADAVNLLWKGGVAVQYFQTAPQGSGSPNYTVGQGTGGLYTPLSGDSVPNDWTPGEVCAQALVVVGVSGPIVTQEVVSAGCQSGWDGYCDSGCAATTGTTVDVLDPAALIGG
jgi:hypothetical protein